MPICFIEDCHERWNLHDDSFPCKQFIAGIFVDWFVARLNNHICILTLKYSTLYILSLYVYFFKNYHIIVYEF